MVAACSGQISKGTFMIGATSNLGLDHHNEIADSFVEHLDYVSVQVRGGIFRSNNFLVGIEAGYENLDGIRESGLGLFARCYNNKNLYLGAGIGTTSYNYGDPIVYRVTSIPLHVGYAAFITNTIALEPDINFTFYGNAGLGSSIGFHLGLAFYFTR